MTIPPTSLSAADWAAERPEYSVDAPPPAAMSAIYYEDYGPPEVLRFGAMAAPQYKSGEVLIRVCAASVNPVDWRMRQGEMRLVLPGHFPRIPGFDVAGYLHRGGESLGLVAGTRVMAFLKSVYGGAYAEWARCPLDAVAAIPDSMTFEEAACLPLAGSTALQSLRDHGHIQSGQRILINGASGGVGSFAVQIAKVYGAHVTAVASGATESYVRSLGADEFINYNVDDFTASAARWDLVFDVAGKSSFGAVRKVLQPHGRYVTTEPDLKGIATSLVTLAMAKRGRAMLARSRRPDLQELIRLCGEGRLRVSIQDGFLLAEAAAAHRLSEQGHVRGKLVLRC